MDPKGYVLCKSEFIATKMWPNKQYSYKGMVDLEKEYKEALAGQQVLVMDISVDAACYLVYAKTKAGDPFIWTIEKEDTVNGSFLALKWKYGILMRADLSPIDEFRYLAEYLSELKKPEYKKP